MPAADSFAARVTSRRKDLVRLVTEGIPPVEYLPASDGMLVRGGRHLLPANAKTGKSLAQLVHTVDMTEAGARVLVLDRENGANEYARRLGDVLEAREFDQPRREQVRKRLKYVEFPALRRTDGPQFARWARKLRTDLVVFDSSRMFLTDMDLAEDSADDYAVFSAAAIEPLFRAGIATLMLDNSGHELANRARGSSAKADLNEVLFKLAVRAPFSRERRGQIALTLEPGRSRYGGEGEWTMSLGGGHFGSWQRVSSPAPVSRRREEQAESLVLRAIAKQAGRSRRAVLLEAKRNGVGEERLRHALDALLAGGDVRLEDGGLHVQTQ